MFLRNKTVAIGCACGVLCALCVFLYLQGVRGEADAVRAEALERFGGEQVEVYLARADIAPGQTIGSADVEKRLWIAELVPEGALTDIDQIAGRQASSSILKGEVVCGQRFSTSANQLDVPEGCTAISIPAQDVQAVGGAVRPGTHVDVYASGTASTDLIASNVLVLATNADAYEEGQGAETKWITVAIEKDSAQEVVAAVSRLAIYFTLPGEKPSDAVQDSAKAADEAEASEDEAAAKQDSEKAAAEKASGEAESEEE